MKPVYQSVDPGVFRDTDNGDCLRACLASILERPLTAVPHFMETRERARTWPQDVAAWLDSHGFELDTLHPATTLHGTLNYMAAHHAGEHYILMGRAGPDFGHVVVGLDDKIVHDPCPRVPPGVISLTGPLPEGWYGVLMIRPKPSPALAAEQRARLLKALKSPG